MFIDIFWIYHQTNQNVGYILDIKNQEKTKTQKMNRCWIYFGYKKSKKQKKTKKMDRCWIYFGYKKSKISKKTHKKMDRCWIYLGYKKIKKHILYETSL